MPMTPEADKFMDLSIKFIIEEMSASDDKGTERNAYFNISRISAVDGLSKCTCRDNRPGRKSALSTLSRVEHATSTNTDADALEAVLMPSISFRNVDKTRPATSFDPPLSAPLPPLHQMH